jgi:hypothetical protein
VASSLPLTILSPFGPKAQHATDVLGVCPDTSTPPGICVGDGVRGVSW